MKIDSVEIEKRLDNFKPDIFVLSNGKNLIIEIAVTHKVGKRKKRKIRKYNVPAIEIRMPEEYALKEKEELINLIKNSTDIKYWLYHPKEKQANLSFYEKYRSVSGRYARYKEYEPSRFGNNVPKFGIRDKSRTDAAPEKNGMKSIEE